MALYSGLDAQFGMVDESTWGTYVAPTTFLAFLGESLELVSERIESASIRAGDRVQSEDEWAVNTKGVSGSVDFELSTKGFGEIWEACLGGRSITTPGGSAPRDHTCTISDTVVPKTVQIGRPSTAAGAVQPYSYTGMKVTGWTFGQALDEMAKISVEWDGQAMSTSQALASASYTANAIRFPFTQCAITVGGVAVAATSFSLTASTGLATDRYQLNSTSNKRVQVPAQLYEMTGELVMEFEDLTEAAYYAAGTEHQVIITHTGATDGIESSYAFTNTITLPVVRWDGGAPTVSDTGIVELALPFKVMADSAGSAAPITVVYRTTDTA